MISMNKTELGDFQTPSFFCKKIVKIIKNKYHFNPRAVLEPTMGLGNFVDASIKEFSNLENIIGLDIEQEYVEFAKQRFSSFAFSHFLQGNAFSFGFKMFNSVLENQSLLCIGNPPWVTNSQLSSMSSKNLPEKTNKIRNAKGVDAITGKSNFDIAEYILIHLFDEFKDRSNTLFAFLVKSSVARNIFKYRQNNNCCFSIFDVFHFDAKKIFGVSCDAVLLVCKLADKNNVDFANEYSIDEPDFILKRYGYVNNIFVSNADSFSSVSDIFGNSQIIWRQGIKHDCSSVMELTLLNGQLFNKLNEDCSFLLNNERVFPLMKSSEIKGGICNCFKHFVIITQNKVGEDTSFLKLFPDLYHYLYAHKANFDARKSIIYKKAPDYAIFGIGEYSFSKYKIAISGLYKKPSFTYLAGTKPVMVDDTCYFIGTNSQVLSFLLFAILDNQITYNYLSSLVFFDSKRPFTKDVLQSIDLIKLIKKIGLRMIINYIENAFKVKLTEEDIKKAILFLERGG